jgi:hypothetical protein
LTSSSFDYVFIDSLLFTKGVLKMADCPSLEKCPFFNDKMAGKTGIINMYKRKYCKEDYKSCARWVISNTVGREHVTLSIYPNMINKANEIIDEVKAKT